MANDLFNHFIAFLLFPKEQGMSALLETVLEAFVYCSFLPGSLVCMLICGLIAVVSHFRFHKIFTHPFWKYAFTLIIVANIFTGLIMVATLIVNTLGAQPDLGEAGIGYAVAQLLAGMPLTIFTIVYLFAFIVRLIRHAKTKRPAIMEGKTSDLSQ